MMKTPMRQVNDHLANAWAAAQSDGRTHLADLIERQWLKAAELAEREERRLEEQQAA